MAQKVSKSLLSPFFKLIHPDVLSSAPIDVKVANSSALRSLNNYFDEIQAGNAVSTQHIRYFLPRKDNYDEVSFTLRSFSGSADPDYRSLHLNSTIRGLLATTQRESSKETMMDFDSKAANYARMEKKRQIKERIEQGIQSDLEAGAGYYRKDPIISEVVARAIRSSLESRLERSHIPVEHLFFSPKLTEDQRKTAILSLTAECYMGPGGPQAVVDLYTEMFTGNSPIPVLIADRYSVTAVPGYLQIPFSVKLQDMIQFFRENKGEIPARLQDVRSRQFIKYSRLTTEVAARLRDLRTVGRVMLGRTRFPNSEEHSAIRFQSYLETLTKLESVLIPEGPMKHFTVIVGKISRKLGTHEIEIAAEATRMEIADLVK